MVLGLGLALAAVLLTSRNLRLGRGDRRGAFRVAAVIVILGIVANLLRLPAAVSTWYSVASVNLARQFFDGALVWIFYIALEPYVRRLWPTTLIAWNRVLEGRLRDPLVGFHTLIGGLFGLALNAMFLVQGPATGFGRPHSWRHSPAPPRGQRGGSTRCSRPSTLRSHCCW